MTHPQTAPEPLHSGSSASCTRPTLVLHTRAERNHAVSHWLLSAADNVPQARTEWAETGITALPCGIRFSAVRIPADIVYAAAGTSDPAAVDDYLARALHGGPVLVCGHGRRYYALLPAHAAHGWAAPGTEALGRGLLLGIPRPDRTGATDNAGHASYWAVPLTSPAALCDPDAILRLIAHGRRQALEETASVTTLPTPSRRTPARPEADTSQPTAPAMKAVRPPETPGKTLARWSFAPALSNARTARRKISSALASEPLPTDAAHDMELLTAELVTNAVQHGAGPVTVELSRHAGNLTLKVTDTGPQLPPAPAQPAHHSEGGRGLMVTEQLADRYGCWPTDEGKTIWCALDLTRYAPEKDAPAAGP